MLSRGMKNKDIQFFFNRPDRPVNSGRISTIGSGTYANSRDIESASEEAVTTFISSQTKVPQSNSVGIAQNDPVGESTIKNLFAQGADGIWRLTVGETDAHECKLNFGMKHPGAWLRAVAALANNSGGYLFFGVHDKDDIGPSGEDLSHAVAGMNTVEFEKLDPASLAMRIKSVFDPTPRFTTKIIEVDTKRVGLIYVEKHASRPVIATKADHNIGEGDIFYRYPGQSTRIKYSDLRAMLDARDNESRSQILPMVERLLQLGPKNAMVADLATGILGDGKTTIRIDPDLVERLTFVKEGEFKETQGSPTLRLIGNVQVPNLGKKAEANRGLLRRSDVFDAFLDQTAPEAPENYIRFALENGQGEWYPLHYFSKLAGMSRTELIEFIKGTDGTESRKTTYIKWVQPGAAYHRASGRPAAILSAIENGKLPAIATALEASHTAQAIEAWPSNKEVDQKVVFGLLRKCMTQLAGTTSISFARRAIGRIDELLYSDRA